MRPYAFFYICIVFAMTFSGSVYADTVTQSQHLSFGTFVLKRNDNVKRLKVARNGTVTSAAAFVVIDPPVPAHWDLTGYPANTLLTVDIPDAIISLDGSGTGMLFSLTEFDPTDALTTDSLGEARLKIGASLYTSGSGTMYPDGDYSGNVMVTISY